MIANNVLKDLVSVLGRNLPRVEKARAIAEGIRKAGSYRWTGLYDVDNQNGLVSNIGWSGAGAPEFPVFPVTKGLTSRAISSKKTVNVGDVANDADYLTALATTQSEIIIPVLDAAREKVLGTIDVESEHPHAFDAAVEAWLEQCATAVRGFWENNGS